MSGRGEGFEKFEKFERFERFERFEGSWFWGFVWRKDKVFFGNLQIFVPKKRA